MLSKAIKRVIFFVQTTFNLRDYQRFGIRLMRENGFDVEVWDLNLILNPELFQSYIPTDAFDNDVVVLFNHRQKVYDKLSNLSHRDFVINTIPYTFSSLWIYRALSKTAADYAVFYGGALPYPIDEKGCLHFFMDKLKGLASFRYLSAWKRLFIKLPSSFFSVKPASLILAGSEKYLSYKRYFDFPVCKNTETLLGHALDYDIYLEEKDKPCQEKSTAVFIEDFFPFDPDYIMRGEEFPIDADTYYSSLNNFFDIVEDKLGLEVVVAAHPRAGEGGENYFRSRNYIRGKTLNLVRESRLVMTHCSTAVSFAVFFYKPVIFMTHSNFNNRHEGYRIKAMADEFKKDPVLVDHYSDNINLKSELTVDRIIYDRYRNNYIKPEDGKDLPFWQIVSDRLKKGF
jgi:hypothetical protein